jgi:glycosyltransferase involved in cell wall biosynthesis
MIVSVETPVFKGRRLRRCIDSVLAQSSPDWRYTLVWDGGDEESRRILEELEREGRRNVAVHFCENRGIARARRYLTEHSSGEYILPLDDDDALPFHAVERFLVAAAEKPWASVIRARRAIMDDDGVVMDTPPWFPFERRHYQLGMVTDIFNHTQPYLIRRTAYDRTSGWEGFPDFRNAGEDCDIYLKLEEAGSIELLDETLYYYRVHDHRASLVLTDQAAYEMWRRLADKTIARIGLPLRRANEKQPFHYERVARPELTLASVDFLVVRDQRTTRIALERLRLALQAAGVGNEQLHVVERSGTADFNEGFRNTHRPLVAILDAGVVVTADGLQSLLRSMAEWDTDLAGPKLVNQDGFIVGGIWALGEDPSADSVGEGEWDHGQHDGSALAPWLCEKMVLVRREVLNAVGGLDEGYATDRTAMMDLCLKARQRDFRCGYFGATQFLVSRSPAPSLATDLDRLRRKWVSYPELLQGRQPHEVLPLTV